MSKSDWGERTSLEDTKVQPSEVPDASSELEDLAATMAQEDYEDSEPVDVGVEQAETAQDEPMFLPLYCNNCLRCTHLVGPLGKKAGDCMDGNPACPAHDVQLGVGVSANLVPEYVRALSEGDLPCLGSINAKLEDAHPVAVREFLKEVRSETALPDK